MTFEVPRRAIEVLAGAVSEAQCDLLRRYAGRLVRAGGRVSVLSRRSLGRLDEHFVDSAAVLSVVDVDRRSVVDLGSGGGLPGVVVAVLRPSANVTLVESRRSKVALLKQVERDLRLPNLEIVHGRVEELAETRSFDVGLSRALGSVEDTLSQSLRLVAVGGRLVLFKGPRWQQEAGDARAIAAGEGAVLERTVEIELPGMGRATTFVVFHVKQRDP
jgi:16S rRNA (guanine527-N7)-methyltransferase